MTTSPNAFRLLAVAAAAALIAACGGGGADAGGSASADAGRATTAPPASRAAGEIVVQVAQGVDIAALASARGMVVLGQFGRRPIYRLQLPAGTDADAEAQRLQQASGVLFAEPNVESETPEGRRNSFWAIGGSQAEVGTQWAADTLRLPQAHAVSTGLGVRVAVLDTGIDTSHPAFAGRLAMTADGRLLGRDFVDDDDNPGEEGSVADAGFGHGTHVAGLVALAAPGARIMPLRVLDRRGTGNAWVLAEALAWAVDPDGRPDTDDGAHIINLSLGSSKPTRLLEIAAALASCELDDDDDFDGPGFDDDRARCALGHGAAVLSAAGNSGSAGELLYPAAEEVKGTRAVTAVTAQNRLADFSNFGGWIKLAAPGERILSAVPGGAWGTWSGTSMATPLAAGTAALVMATRSPAPRSGAGGLRQWTPDDVLKRLEDRAKPVCGASVKQIDAAGAVSDVDAAPPSCP